MQDLGCARARAQLRSRELERYVVTTTDGAPNLGGATASDELDYAPVAADATA
jgi:hypothetical protein